ncbi:MAG: DUF1015 domain-containing protein [Flavobacteriales bacterium]|jgi:uncharacterized protein (DUF1015 family)|nr:DUF1015 domain-containing protein [Flavobacteriales bacterium]
MSIFIPFKAYLPNEKYTKEIVSRPYDVLNAKEAKDESKGKANSFYHVIKPEIDFPDNIDYYSAKIYQKGKDNFDKLVENGMMKQDKSNNYYVYQLIMNGHKQTGIVGCCAIDDYFNNTIKKHELTRKDKEEDRKNHIRYSKLNYEPVFFAYPKVNDIDSIVDKIKNKESTYNFITEDNIQHTLWTINDNKIKILIQKLFSDKVPNIYVADGHHRTAAGALVGKELRDKAGGNATDGKHYNYFMAVLFPDNQLNIIDYNRVVRDLNGLEPSSLIERLSQKFNITRIEKSYKPKELHHIGMYLDKKWYKLVIKDGLFDAQDPVDVLDVTILSKQILEPILDIKDLRSNTRIDFVGGIRGVNELEKRVDSGEMKIAFTLYPVSMQQIMNISNNNMIMPPKVTWFEPKLRSGLTVYSLV